MAEKTPLQIEREGIHTRMVSAFVRRDYAFLDSTVSRDVSFHLAGASPLAGTITGHEAFIDFLVQTASIVRSAAKPIIYTHSGDTVTASREVVLISREGEVETTAHTTFTFGVDGMVRRISVVVDD